MQYIHIKNLEKYQPGYTDRRHIWAKIYYESFLDEKVQTLCEIDRYRFWSLIVFEVFFQKSVPLNATNLKIMGWESRKRHISLTLQALHTLIEVRNEELKKTVPQSRVEKSRVEKNKYMSIFNEARKIYPGTKLGLKTEFDNFRKKHKDWLEVLPLLHLAIQSQIRGRQKIGVREFVPPWKNFKTWTNNRCWEEEGKAVDRPETPEEKTKREKAEAVALEKRKQEIRDDDGQYYREQSTEDLQKWMANPKSVARRWLIKEILAKRTKR